MRDWLKTYGWLAAASVSAGGIAHQLQHDRIATVMFSIAAFVISVGVASLVFPVLNRAFSWAKKAGKALFKLIRYLISFVSRALIAITTWLLRPAVTAVLRELHVNPAPALWPTYWLAHRKLYFDRQRADLRPLVNEGFCPLEISFECSSTSPYWRAGLLLAGLKYEPSRNNIFGGLLIHVAKDNYDDLPHLYVYVRGRLEKHIIGRDPEGGKYRFAITLHTGPPANDLTTAAIDVEGFESPRIYDGFLEDFIAKPFLAAWADGRDFRVRFRNIQATWVAHDFHDPL